jgi:hypothetical protein
MPRPTTPQQQLTLAPTVSLAWWENRTEILTLLRRLERTCPTLQIGVEESRALRFDTHRLPRILQGATKRSAV